MQLQHVNVKLLVRNPGQVDLEPLIPVFHNWIQEQPFAEMLLDVADYRHVHEGPGIMVIGHQGNYSVDNTDGRLGVLYNRKAALDGENGDRLRQAARAALLACQKLEGDDRLGGKLQFNGHDLEIMVNDRLLAPNSESTRIACQDDIDRFLTQLFGDANYSKNYGNDPRSRFRVSVKAVRSFSVGDLLANLKS